MCGLIILEKSEPGVLFLDDDIAITTQLKEILSQRFTIYTANNKVDAYKILKDKDIGVVISDHYMPDITGIEFLTDVLKNYPLIRRLLISGKMDVNIAMESIDISKVHKILTKPFKSEQVIEELISQLGSYNSSLEYKTQLTEFVEQDTNPFEIYVKQIKEIYSLFMPIWQNDQESNNATVLPQVINKLVKFSAAINELYINEPSKYREGLNFIKQNLEDLYVIADYYKQINLLSYVSVLLTYYALLEEDVDEAKRYYCEYLNSSFLISEAFRKSVLEDVNILPPIMGDEFVSEIALDARVTDKIRGSITNVFLVEMQPYINLNETFLRFTKGYRTEFYTVLIIKNETIIYFKDKFDSIDSLVLNNAIETIQKLSGEILHKSIQLQTMQFKGGVIQIQSYNNLQYVLISSENSIESRIKLRLLMIETLDVVERIQEKSPLTDPPTKSLNKKTNELFGL
ncbi:MAG: response regulator [Candidatus Kariarchaeaceae archaeon]|jgi:CheY-like chemotaxis protein